MNKKQKFYLHQCHEIALKKQGKCMSNTYTDFLTNLHWQCKNGHEWFASPKAIKRGRWCKLCHIDTIRLNIDYFKKIAKERQGKCLSTSYKNSHQILEWECVKGHVWKASGNNVKRGSWCKKCSDEKNAEQRRASINNIQDLALSKGGRCLSENYLSQKEKLEWQCSEGHKWFAFLGTIKSGKWCQKCANKKITDAQRDTIQAMTLLAKEMDGFCLSEKYINARTNLKWKCSKNHTWSAAPHTIKNGQWCPKCRDIKNSELQIGSIEDMHKYAAQKGGFCLSKKYINSTSHIKWKCADGHVWKAVPSSIKQGSWCPRCTIYLKEEMCRSTFEQIFEKPFNKIKPNWLINEKGNKLELDGYSEFYKIAFEYNGEQHYKTGFFGNEESLNKTRYHDDLKKKLCKQNKVVLIIISYEDDFSKLPGIIKNQLKIQNYKIDKINFNIKIDFNKFSLHNKKLTELKEITIKKNGSCLSKIYLGVDKKLLWQCKRS